MKVSLIAAVASNGVIGRNNDLPWHLPDDMKYFMETTKGHYVILGRKNYESLPPKYKPLPNRHNIVVTRRKNFDAPGCEVVHTIGEGFAIAKRNGESEVMVIGGAEIYELALPVADRLYLTEIKADVEGDVRFPAFDRSAWQEVSRVPHGADERHKFAFDFVVYDKKNRPS